MGVGRHGRDAVVRWKAAWTWIGTRLAVNGKGGYSLLSPYEQPHHPRSRLPQVQGRDWRHRTTTVAMRYTNGSRTGWLSGVVGKPVGGVASAAFWYWVHSHYRYCGGVAGSAPWKMALSVIVLGVTLFVAWQVWHALNQALAQLLELEKLH